MIDLKILQKENEELRQQYEIARKIVTPDGFYQMWFESLPNYKSGAKAFEFLNELHYKIVRPAKYKYSSYATFLNIIKRKRDEQRN